MSTRHQRGSYVNLLKTMTIHRIIEPERDFEEFLRALPIHSSARGGIDRYKSALASIHTDCFYKHLTVDSVNRGSVYLHDIEFSSEILAAHLSKGDEVSLYCCSLKESDLLREIDDTLLQYISHAWYSHIVKWAARRLEETLYGDNFSAAFNPGSLPDWRIEDVTVIQKILSDASSIRKISCGQYSVTGILFSCGAKKNNCSYCSRVDCLYRRY